MAHTWGTNDMKEALPNAEASAEATAGTEAVTETATVDHPNPQAYGWAEKQDYDYESYNLTNKDALEKIHAEGSGPSGGWASNAATVSEHPILDKMLIPSNITQYEWSDEYGDVGPEHPELEKQLFGDEFHVKTGIEFNK